jgi:MFS family permease
VQLTAQNWMVLSLTGSAFFLGLDSFLQQLPIMLFTLVGGVLADRRDRRRTLLGSQYVQMATATVLALLVYFDLVTITYILMLSFMTGLAQAFGGPAYQSLVPSLVDKKDLPNAVALNSIQFNIARVLGPLLFEATLSFTAGWGFGDNSRWRCASRSTRLAFLVVINADGAQGEAHSAGERAACETSCKAASAIRQRRGSWRSSSLAAATAFLGFAVLTFLPVFTKNGQGAGT